MIFFIQFNLKVCCLFIHNRTVDSSLYFPPENGTFLFLASSLSWSGHFNLFRWWTLRDLECFSHSAGSLQDLCSNWPFCLQVQRFKVNSPLRWQRRHLERSKSMRGREPAETLIFNARSDEIRLICSVWTTGRREGGGSRKRTKDIISSFDVVGSLCGKASWAGVWRIVCGELYAVMNF